MMAMPSSQSYNVPRFQISTGGEDRYAQWLIQGRRVAEQ